MRIRAFGDKPVAPVQTLELIAESSPIVGRISSYSNEWHEDRTLPRYVHYNLASSQDASHVR